MGSISSPQPATADTRNTHIPVGSMPLISPSALLHAHLGQSPPLRPSNRLPSQPRTIDLNIRSLNHTNGSSLVKIGATTIVCGVRAEILPVSEIPSYRVNKGYASDVPKDGDEDEDQYQDAIRLYHLLVPNIELGTGCSPLHPANTAPSVEAQSISQRILSLLHSSRLLQLSDLEIKHTPEESLSANEAAELGILQDDGPQLKAYWVLYIDMLCLSHSGTGSVFDAAWLALYAALKDTVLPRATWDQDEHRIVCSPEMAEATKLEPRGMPVPCSFGMFVPEHRSVPDAKKRYEGRRLLVDLDTFEEESVEDRGCVVVDLDGDEVTVQRIEKSGGENIGVNELKEMVKVASKRWKEWRIVIEKAWKEAG
jgi:exosome complex component RRP43